MAMRYAGKLAGVALGAAAGYTLYRVPGLVAGAIAGGAAGALLDAMTSGGEDHGLELETIPTRADIDADLRRLFARHLCRVCVAVASADGEVSREEARAIRDFFAGRLGFTGPELEMVREELKALVAEPPSLEDAAARADGALDGAVKQLLFQALFEISLADGPLSREEREAIAEVGTILDIPEDDQRAIRALFFEEADRAYELLGLSPDAPDAEVKRRFRQLAAAAHPDKVATLGPEAVALAEAKFREIEGAWDQIRRQRGL